MLPLLEDWNELARLVLERPTLYLRYSKGPRVDAANGRSRDYEAGVEMPGLSVTTIAPEPWWPRPADDWIARRLCKYAELEDAERFPWLTEGRLVGFGPDHEPLIAVTEPVARIGRRLIEEGARRYADRFDVGEDSRPDQEVDDDRSSAGS